MKEKTNGYLSCYNVCASVAIAISNLFGFFINIYVFEDITGAHQIDYATDCINLGSLSAEGILKALRGLMLTRVMVQKTYLLFFYARAAAL